MIIETVVYLSELDTDKYVKVEVDRSEFDLKNENYQ